MYDIIILLLFYPETMWTVREWPSFREEQGRAPRRDGFIQTKGGPEEGAGGRMEAGGTDGRAGDVAGKPGGIRTK